MRPSSITRGLVALALTATSTFAVLVLAEQPASAAAPDIPLANQRAHLQQFQNIANANGGTRRSTTSGYTASVNYVFNQLSAAGFTVVRQNCTSGCTAGAGPNVIADWPGGNANNVYMFGAHLDSVSAGPGMNDNGSGSATVLELALTLARTNPTMLNHVRFAFWTDEEQGLNGSQFYANTLPTAERSRIRAYFNFDMVASVNAGYFINRITSAPGLVVKQYYDSIGVPTEENTEGVGRSDDASFNAIGVQSSGVAAGASRVKTAAQVAKWGGTQSAHDPCYHRACDTFPSNVSDTVLNRSGDAAAHALWTLAVDAGGGGTTVYSDTFESATGWTTNPNGTDTATTGAWQRGDPAQTTSGVVLQLGTTVSGTNDLVTGAAAGASAGEFDVDGGTTSIQSPTIALPASGTLSLSFSWYLAHLNNATSADFFRASVVNSGGTATTVFTQAGSAANRAGAWATATVNVSSFAGQTIRIRFEAADAATGSLVEAGVDNVVITQN